MNDRIVFKRGKQGEFLKKAKELGKYSWKELAHLCKVNEGTLLVNLRTEKTTVSIELFNNVIKEFPSLRSYKNYIEEIKPRYWGSKKAAKITNKKQGKKITVKENNQEMSELIGIILGDGNLYSNKKSGNYYLCIVGDRKEEDYLIGFVKPLIEGLFGTEVKISRAKKSNTTYLKLQGRRVIEYFIGNHDLIPGNKIENRLRIPKWIQKNNDFLKACIRGLIDTDGSVFRLSKKDPNIIRISFKNFNNELMFDMKSSLIKLGYNPSKVTHKSIYITKKENVNRYMNDIGFNNPKHRRRYEEIAL
ncbi:MAG: LAGLIDADG family homing endonuclease [Nanoarchaeota archaeon]